MPYAVKELYYTLQGEGLQSGKAAVFCRFAGCNLWSGREADRATAVCSFCDTDFAGVDGPGGGLFTSAGDLARRALAAWPAHAPGKLIVCTGGEPLLQLDDALINAFHTAGFRVAIETNGTIPVPGGIDHVCVSPKAHTGLLVTSGHELKLVYPQEGLDPTDVAGLMFDAFFLQPMDGPSRDRNTALVVAYCLEHPQWRMSLQLHKLVGLP